MTPAARCINAREILIPIGKPAAENGPTIDTIRKAHPITEKTRMGFAEYFDINQSSKLATTPGSTELMTTGTIDRGTPPERRISSLMIPAFFEIT